MKLPMYQVDAFTNEQFKGNPAAICPLNEWLADEMLQNIAAENNLSETAYFVKKDNDYELRWFTPTGEVDLCGHATLATAFVIYTFLDHNAVHLTFHTKSGPLEVEKEGELFTLMFPSRAGEKCDIPEALIKGLGKAPKEVYKSRDYLAVFDTEHDILNLELNFDELEKLDSMGVIVTAKGTNVDFVSRYFAPKVGINEDPVTGSTHCTLVPYWKDILHKTEFMALQLSKRGGKLYCTDLGDKVKICGKAVVYLEGVITI